MKTEQDYALEFDEAVSGYIEWLASLDSSKVKGKNKWSAFVGSVDSAIKIWGSYFNNQAFEYCSPAFLRDCFLPSSPLDSREDLSPEQKDLVILASTAKGWEESLDKILISGTANAEPQKKSASNIVNQFRELYESQKKDASDSYNRCKEAYVAHALKRKDIFPFFPQP